MSSAAEIAAGLTKAQREKARYRLMLKLARAHDRTVSERERGAEMAIKCGNGMATAYWREQAKVAERHFRRILQETPDD